MKGAAMNFRTWFLVVGVVVMGIVGVWMIHEVCVMASNMAAPNVAEIIGQYK
jgi:uncharacterized membrane protein